MIFPQQANGSLIKNEKGEIVGSKLIGQKFESENYFHPRPSAANDYELQLRAVRISVRRAQKLIERVKAETEKLKLENPSEKVPVELVTTSASGLDPQISPEAAEFQIPRIAKARNRNEAEIEKLIEKNTEGRTFGIFGEPRVNVLLLNLELDKTIN